MIKEITLKDSKEFYRIGVLLNQNFNKLYDLEKILEQDYSYIYGYYMEGKLVAFLHIEKSYDEIDIVNIVVKEELQGHNIGTALLSELFKTFDDVIKYNLEVRASNLKAINLYKKFDFTIANNRKNYYEGEDGYLMIKEVKR